MEDEVADHDVLVEVHHVCTLYSQAQPLVDEGDVGCQGIVLVEQSARPPFVVHPGELPIGPHSQPALVAVGLVLQADVGVVDIPQRICAVKIDEQVAVAKRKVTGHETSYPTTSTPSSTWIGYVAIGSSAGSITTSPVRTLNCEPCQGQVTISPASDPSQS